MPPEEELLDEDELLDDELLELEELLEDELLEEELLEEELLDELPASVPPPQPAMINTTTNKTPANPRRFMQQAPFYYPSDWERFLKTFGVQPYSFLNNLLK